MLIHLCNRGIVEWRYPVYISLVSQWLTMFLFLFWSNLLLLYNFSNHCENYSIDNLKIFRLFIHTGIIAVACKKVINKHLQILRIEYNYIACIRVMLLRSERNVFTNSEASLDKSVYGKLLLKEKSILVK